jgi:PAS domain S-box-containing protein
MSEWRVAAATLSIDVCGVFMNSRGGKGSQAKQRPSATQPSEHVRSPDTASENDIRRLQRELQQHQIELEAVNRQLAISEERARQAIEASNAAIWDFDLTTGEVYLSEAWSSFLGGDREPTDTTIDALYALVPEEERQEVMDAFVRAVRVDGIPEYRLNHRVQRPDGSLIWIHSRGRVVERDRGGRALRMIGVNFNITERIEAESRMIESEQRFRALFESAGDYALVLELQEDAPPKIVDGNRAFFEKHGYSREELIGQPITMLETGPSAERVAERVENVKQIKAGVPVRFEVEHRCKDGSTFVADIVVNTVREGSGNLVFSVERDTTERRRAEQEQQRLLAQNHRLLQQLIRVQEEERRALARDLHDELGQLLTSIDARAEYISQHAVHAEVRDMASEIVRATQASFIANRATLAKLRPSTLDALGLKAALTELVEKTKRKSIIDCSLRIDGEIDDIVDDLRAITIYRLVQEALTNAQRHGKADRAEVVVRHIPPHEKNPARIEVEIRDNGQAFDVEAVSQGMGVIGMRERIRAVGGVFELTYVPGDGVRVQADIPMAKQDAR